MPNQVINQPADSHLHTHHHENLKSHFPVLFRKQKLLMIPRYPNCHHMHVRILSVFHLYYVEHELEFLTKFMPKQYCGWHWPITDKMYVRYNVDKLTTCRRVLFEKLTVSQSRKSNPFTEPRSSLTFSQELTTEPLNKALMFSSLRSQLLCTNLINTFKNKTSYKINVHKSKFSYLYIITFIKCFFNPVNAQQHTPVITFRFFGHNWPFITSRSMYSQLFSISGGLFPFTTWQVTHFTWHFIQLQSVNFGVIKVSTQHTNFRNAESVVHLPHFYGIGKIILIYARSTFFKLAIYLVFASKQFIHTLVRQSQQ